MPTLAWIVTAGTAMALIAPSSCLSSTCSGTTATAPAPHEKIILTGGFAVGLLLLGLTAALAR